MAFIHTDWIRKHQFRFRFFPHNSSTFSSDSSTTNAANPSSSSPAVNPLSAKPSVIDSTKDINGYSDLNVGPQTTSSSFLNDGHSPAPLLPESPVQGATKSKTSSPPLTMTTTTTRRSNTNGIDRKRKSEMVGMEELEDTLLGVAKDGSVLVMPGGENVGVKAKRRKDYIRTGSTESV